MCKLVAAAVFDFHRNGGGDARTDTRMCADKCTHTHTGVRTGIHMYVHTNTSWSVQMHIKMQRHRLTYKVDNFPASRNLCEHTQTRPHIYVFETHRCDTDITVTKCPLRACPPTKLYLQDSDEDRCLCSAPAFSLKIYRFYSINKDVNVDFTTQQHCVSLRQ